MTDLDFTVPATLHQYVGEPDRNGAFLAGGPVAEGELGSMVRRVMADHPDQRWRYNIATDGPDWLDVVGIEALAETRAYTDWTAMKE